MRKLLTLLGLLTLPLQAAIPLPPAPTRYVTDAASVLDDAREEALNESLAHYDRDTTNQILVYVDRTLPAGTTLEEMSAEAIRTWKVGQAKQDNGAILFFFIDDRESRLEVGYGLEGVLTDAVSKRILVSLRPALQSADYIGASEQGVAEIRQLLGAPAEAAAVVDPVQARAAEIAAKEPGPVAMFLITLAFFFLIVLLLIGWLKGYVTIGGGSSSSSSSSRSSSSSSFRGGGGSGGGGGASDKW